MGTRNLKAFDITVTFHGVTGDTPELAKAELKAYLIDTFVRLPDTTIRIPWSVNQPEEIK